MRWGGYGDGSVFGGVDEGFRWWSRLKDGSLRTRGVSVRFPGGDTAVATRMAGLAMVDGDWSRGGGKSCRG